jgi:hypothetical protein
MAIDEDKLRKLQIDESPAMNEIADRAAENISLCLDKISPADLSGAYDYCDNIFQDESEEQKEAILADIIQTIKLLQRLQPSKKRRELLDEFSKQHVHATMISNQHWNSIVSGAGLNNAGEIGSAIGWLHEGINALSRLHPEELAKQEEIHARNVNDDVDEMRRGIEGITVS